MLRVFVLSGVFLLSGAAALAFETLWFRQARLAFGQSVWASSVVLSSFMAGMAAGNWLCARFGDRARHALRWYALLELSIAITGVALVFALPEVGRIFAPWVEPLAAAKPALNALRLACSFALLLVPAAAMGITLPLLVRAASAWDANFGRVLGVLYAANTFGAVGGAVLTETVLLEHFGVRGSALWAGGAAIAAAVSALALARSVRGSPPTASVVAPAPAVPWRTGATFLGVGFLAGFTLLALEVVWLRFLLLFLNDTPLVFAAVLGTVLAGIAIGGAVASVWSSASPRAADRAWLAGYAAGLLGLAGYWIYPRFLQGQLSPYPSASAIVLLASPLVLPTAIASGALFTLCGAGLRKLAGTASVAVGRLSFANTIGAGLGPLVAGFLLLPQLGMERSLFLLFALYGVVGFALARAARVSPLFSYGGLVVFSVLLALYPVGMMRTHYIRASLTRWTQDRDPKIHVRESANATIVHVLHHANGVPLSDHFVTNAYSMTGNGFAARRYMKLFAYLPLAIHPRIERALIIGYGIGNTVEALTDASELERIDVVDISADMLALSKRARTRSESSPLADPRVRVHIEDGRFQLQASSARYDLITGEPPPPIIAGVVNLYTREYFELVRSRLARGGIASYWLPVVNISASSAKAVIRSFCAAFSDCSLWHGTARHFVLLGTRDARGPVAAEHFRRLWDDALAQVELRALGFEQPGQLGALFIGDAPYLQQLTAAEEPLTDDQPQRMRAPRDLAERDALIWQWRDTRAARLRFANSALIARFFPEAEREAALPMFDAQHILNDLLFPHPQLRNTRVLHGLLFGTQLRLPVLLLLGSDPDHQRALARLSPAERSRPEWLMHRAAGHLADRDLEAALSLLEKVPTELQPLPDLREYVAYAVRRRPQALTLARDRARQE